MILKFHKQFLTLRLSYLDLYMIKSLSISFLSLIISTVILVHVLVPHHYHGGVPCFTWDITEQACCSQEHNAAEYQHDCASHQHPDHQLPDEGVCCMFKQALFLNTQDDKNEHQCDVCMHNHINNLIQAVLLSFNYEYFVPDGGSIGNPPPYLITYHSIDASRISGLRAPPVA